MRLLPDDTIKLAHVLLQLGKDHTGCITSRTNEPHSGLLSHLWISRSLKTVIKSKGGSG